MTRRSFFCGLVLAVVTGALGAADKNAAKPPKHDPAGKVDNEQVIAYYFHRQFRCVSCEDMEQRVREVIEQRFADALASKRLIFKTVNYDQPENQVFVQKYKLNGPSLVVARLKEGKDLKWKELDAILEHAGDSVKFNRYVYSEINQFLNPKNK
jgi:hypothetical protein